MKSLWNKFLLVSLFMFCGCRLMNGSSGLMLVGLNAIGMSGDSVFGPFVLSEDFLLQDGVDAETVFAFHDPDGYNVVFRGMIDEGNGVFEQDIELFQESRSQTFQFLSKSKARLLILIEQDGDEVLHAVVDMDDVFENRKRGRLVYNYYPLIHIGRKDVDVWKDCRVRVKVIEGTVVPKPENIKVQLAVVGEVVL